MDTHIETNVQKDLFVIIDFEGFNDQIIMVELYFELFVCLFDAICLFFGLFVVAYFIVCLLFDCG